MEDTQTLLKDRRALGVIVARMQVPMLTTSHIGMLLTCIERHDRSVIFLGTAEGMSKSNPYPFLFRRQMIKQFLSVYKHTKVAIIPLPDHADNKAWVQTLDAMIRAQIVLGESAVLYGGRDSFIPYYKKDEGRFECIELSPNDYDSGTALRELAAIPLPVYSVEAANAILWTINQLK